MNSSILFEGKEYISAIRASKKVGYASDYVGQLCRAKKIPGRLIGKTWYVDFSSLIDHKRNRKLGKRKKSEINASVHEVREIPAEKIEIQTTPTQKLNETTKESLSEVHANTFPITYEKDLVQLDLPTLSKTTLSEVKKSKKLFIPKTYAPLVVSLVLFVGIIISQTGNIFNNSFLPINNENLVASVSDWFRNTFYKSLNTSSEFAGTSEVSPSGVVVFPDSGNRLGVTDRIRNIFSDEVEVNFDKEGNAGVIVPTFKEGDDFENFAFVLVPVDDKESTPTKIQ